MSCFKFIILDTTLVKQWYKTEIEVEPVHFREISITNVISFCLSTIVIVVTKKLLRIVYRVSSFARLTLFQAF